MRTFLKIVFGSCLGVFLAMIGLILISLVTASTIGSMFMKKDKGSLESNSVLRLDFNQLMPDRTNNIKSNFMSLNNSTTVGLVDALRLIRNAKTDPNISGILINPGSSTMLGTSGLKDMNEAIKEFKTSNKFVYSYVEDLGKGGYYISTVADKIFLNPIGSVEWRGNGMVLTYFKNLLDKLNIKMNIFYVGKFKSATEPLRSDKMSPENRKQLKEFLSDFNNSYVKEVAINRNLDPQLLNDLANNLSIHTAEDALKYKFVDKLAYQDEVFDDIKAKLKIAVDKKINFISLNEYYDATTLKKDYSARDKVVVIYAEGEINDGNSSEGEVGGQKYVQYLRKARYDKDVKAVVLRVNSPGGSAYASEQMWHEIDMLKKAGKKVVVSMGDYAASGGYYISCNADKIFASPNTITGSIGVFGLIPDISGFMKDKLYVTTDTVQTGPNAIPINPFIPMSPTQREFIQKSVERTYHLFLSRVAEGRHLPATVVDSLAQGRIYSGTAALKLKLVDQIGNMEDALKSAASMASLKEYRTVEYPEPKEGLVRLIEQITGENKDEDLLNSALRSELSKIAPEYMDARNIMNNNSVQARIPFIIKLH